MKVTRKQKAMNTGWWVQKCKHHQVDPAGVFSVISIDDVFTGHVLLREMKGENFDIENFDILV